MERQQQIRKRKILEDLEFLIDSCRTRLYRRRKEPEPEPGDDYAINVLERRLRDFEKEREQLEAGEFVGDQWSNSFISSDRGKTRAMNNQLVETISHGKPNILDSESESLLEEVQRKIEILEHKRETFQKRMHQLFQVIKCGSEEIQNAAGKTEKKLAVVHEDMIPQSEKLSEDQKAEALAEEERALIPEEVKANSEKAVAEVDDQVMSGSESGKLNTDQKQMKIPGFSRM